MTQGIYKLNPGPAFEFVATFTRTISTLSNSRALVCSLVINHWNYVNQRIPLRLTCTWIPCHCHVKYVHTHYPHFDKAYFHVCILERTNLIVVWIHVHCTLCLPTFPNKKDMEKIKICWNIEIRSGEKQEYDSTGCFAVQFYCYKLSYVLSFVAVRQRKAQNP